MLINHGDENKIINNTFTSFSLSLLDSCTFGGFCGVPMDSPKGRKLS